MVPARSGPSPLLVLLLVLRSCLGCTDIARLKQCDHVADMLNPTLDQIEQMGAKALPPTPSRYIKVADRYSELARTVRAIHVTDPRLGTALLDYAGVLSQAEKNLRDSANALRKSKKPAENLSRHQVMMAGVLQQEQAVMGRIRGVCKAM